MELNSKENYIKVIEVRFIFLYILVVPSLRSVPSGKNFPKLLQSQFIAPNCTIIGDVTTGHKSSLFFGVVIRGENCSVKIGSNTVIQDNTQILNNSSEKIDIVIGHNVTIGANCYIDGASIGDNVVIGNGASIYRGAIIENNSFIAAGAVVAPGTKVPKNQLWVGNPAQYLRDIKPEEKDIIAENREELMELSDVLVEETEKNQHEIFTDKISTLVRNNMNQDELEYIEKNMVSYSAQIGHNDEMGVDAVNEGYDDIFDEGKDRSTYDRPAYSQNMKFEPDLRNYPDYFKIYNENYKRYEEINRNADKIAEGEPRDIFENNKLKPSRPGAMRAWVSKWDSDFNTTFKNTGSKVEQTSK